MKNTLIIVGIAMGVLAGLLVVTFDFSPYKTTLLIILAVVGLIDIILIGLAYKRGKLGTHSFL
jgi:uncharacterized membrane protein